jgi:hypothetical protein
MMLLSVIIEQVNHAFFVNLTIPGMIAKEWQNSAVKEYNWDNGPDS